MKQAVLIAILAVALLGAWLLISSSSSNVASSLSERDKRFAHEMQQIFNAFDDMPFTPAFNNHRYMALDDGTLLFCPL